MKLAMTLGYWGAQPPADAVPRILEAERLGYDAVYTAESWGSDAFTPLAWWGSQTSTIKLGTSIVQLSGRTPTATAMATLSLDHLSGGRVILGLGVSGPQVVEGWYGQPFSKPLARTREYIDIIRQVLAREAPVTNDGPHYPLPYHGPGAMGIGKPLKPITHPLRADVPIYLGAEGPKNIAQTAEIADGWLPIYYSPKIAKTYQGWLDEGFARPGARQTAKTFEIATNCAVQVTKSVDDIPDALGMMRATLAFYIGGMGAKDHNFHKDVFARMGYEAEVEKIQDLFFQGKRDEAIAAVPLQAAEDISLVGPKEKIRDDLAMWEEAGVTTLVVFGSTIDDLRSTAEVILG